MALEKKGYTMATADILKEIDSFPMVSTETDFRFHSLSENTLFCSGEYQKNQTYQIGR